MLIKEKKMAVFPVSGKRRNDQMKPDYKNWMPKGMVLGFLAGAKSLDVGCGSGALAIAVAKRNPKAEVIGIDRWGKEYASFSKNLCERNAKAESAGNTLFGRGDATRLDFPDEIFDAVTSNYV